MLLTIKSFRRSHSEKLLNTNLIFIQFQAGNFMCFHRNNYSINFIFDRTVSALPTIALFNSWTLLKINYEITKLKAGNFLFNQLRFLLLAFFFADSIGCLRKSGLFPRQHFAVYLLQWFLEFLLRYAIERKIIENFLLQRFLFNGKIYLTFQFVKIIFVRYSRPIKRL